MLSLVLLLFFFLLLLLFFFLFFFFFSSRRRHTRWNCDWSSDVCSSDAASRRFVSSTELRKTAAVHSRSKTFSGPSSRPAASSSTDSRSGPSSDSFGAAPPRRCARSPRASLASKFRRLPRRKERKRPRDGSAFAAKSLSRTKMKKDCVRSIASAASRLQDRRKYQ